MNWTVFGPAMFPYCSRRILRLRLAAAAVSPLLPTRNFEGREES